MFCNCLSFFSLLLDNLSLHIKKKKTTTKKTKNVSLSIRYTVCIKFFLSIKAYANVLKHFYSTLFFFFFFIIVCYINIKTHQFITDSFLFLNNAKLTIVIYDYLLQCAWLNHNSKIKLFQNITYHHTHTRTQSIII